MVRVMLLTVCAVAIPILGSVPAASFGDRDSVGYFQMRVGSTAGKPRLKGRSGHKSVDEGGQNHFIHRLPSRLKPQVNPNTMGRVKRSSRGSAIIAVCRSPS